MEENVHNHATFNLFLLQCKFGIKKGSKLEKLDVFEIKITLYELRCKFKPVCSWQAQVQSHSSGL